MCNPIPLPFSFLVNPKSKMRSASRMDISKPLFDMEIAFEKIEENKTQISFRMIFETAEECGKIKNFAGPKNEENFDRLENELGKMNFD